MRLKKDKSNVFKDFNPRLIRIKMRFSRCLNAILTRKRIKKRSVQCILKL